MAQTSRQYIQRMQIIHGAQLFMLIVFALASFLIRRDQREDSIVYLIALAVIIVVCVGLSRMFFRNLASKAGSEMTLGTKLTKYFSAYIVRLALLEAPGLISVVIVLLTGNIGAYVGTLGAIILIFLVRPSAALITEELALSNDERSRINDPNGIVQD